MSDQEIDELKKKVEKHERFISRLIEIMENEGECPNNDDYGQQVFMVFNGKEYGGVVITSALKKIFVT